MQFSTFFTAAIILAVASTEAPKCKYAYGSYTATCKRGNNIFCGGMTGICGGGLKESFDDVATKANEASCGGIKPGTGCNQTVRCCTAAKKRQILQEETLLSFDD
ncbi:uncharacterized protein RAG0_09956 [Rhynchosporium agropyri]|uniref:Uncharacterized protein n=1 Tax=Rhynchosporium agropyri TaxID=914238 RepID=A0A1E1KXX2_9HELO|nr:uncharacterized protein RAG0_09956 [Rhynchosporium agropyri]